MTAPEDLGDPELRGVGFRAVRGGGAAARFAAAEAVLLRDLVGQVADLVGADLPADPGPDEALDISGSSRPPDNPVLARLLPDAYPDDPQAAGDFRRYTEQGLRAGKVACARTLLGTLPAAGGRVRLSSDEAQAWLRALNDVRLALGVRLQVTEDADEMRRRAAQGGQQAAALWVYDWLTLLQETLVEALSC